MGMGKTVRIGKYPAFSKFKKNVGNNNHMLITACIGLDKIDESDIGKNQPALWKPNKWDNSVHRSREFVLKAGLAWTMDCLDVLLKDLFPYFFHAEDIFIKHENGKIEKRKTLETKISAKDEELKYTDVYRSIYNKYRVIEDLFLAQEEDIEKWRRQADFRPGKEDTAPYFPKLELIFALIDLSIQWRNHLVHEGIDNTLKQDTVRILRKYEKELNTNTYGTLELEPMLKHFKNNDKPTFKETAVLIRNVIDFGYVINAYWMNCIDVDTYITECLEQLPPKFCKSIKTFTQERKLNSICIHLCNKGIILEDTEDNVESNEEKIVINYLKKNGLIE
jgi:hypothetical protein